MARIEYLINNPNEVEISDLDLLNTEIEKYPYFYSLRALKLLALKKSEHSDYEKELQLTTIFNNDRKQLYAFLHPEFNSSFTQFLHESKAIDNISVGLENISEHVQTAEQNISISEIDSTIEPLTNEVISDIAIEEDLTEEAFEQAEVEELIVAEQPEDIITETSEELIEESLTDDIIEQTEVEELIVAEQPEDIISETSEEIIEESLTDDIIEQTEVEEIIVAEQQEDIIPETSEELIEASLTDYFIEQAEVEELIVAEQPEDIITETSEELIEESLTDDIIEQTEVEELIVAEQPEDIIPETSEEIIEESLTDDIIEQTEVEELIVAEQQEDIIPETSEELIEASLTDDIIEQTEVEELIVADVIKTSQLDEVMEQSGFEEILSNTIGSVEISDIQENLNLNEEILINDYDSQDDVLEEINKSSAFQENVDAIITEPTIESIIEEFKIQEHSISEQNQELVNFDLPQINVIEPSIEKSLEVVQELLETDQIISKAIEETKEVELSVPSQEPVIEQVELINRSKDIILIDDTPGEIVSAITPFQVLNPKDEIKGGFNQRNVTHTFIENQELSDNIETIDAVDQLMINETNNGESIDSSDISITNDDVIQREDSINTPVSDNESIVEIPSTPINEVIVEDQNNSLQTEENHIIDSSLEPDHSFSFNDWLKIPSAQSMETQTEKEHKYQIIDDFLEKNPKIKPLKKQEIPESKAEVKDIKNTDFSDLMTETLAQIYIEQKQYEKAIKAYKILILKYPEKNSLFANQIKEIENLKNSK